MKTSLNIKYTILNVIVLIVLVVVVSLFFVRQQIDSYKNQILNESENYIKILESSIAKDLLDLNINRISEHIFFIKQNPEIEYAYVLNDQGEIIAAGNDSLIYKIPEDSFQKEVMASDSFLVQENKFLFDVSKPVFAGESKIGTIRIGYSKSKLTTTSKEFEDTVLYLGLFVIVFGSILVYLIILRISKPIKKLNSLTHQITLGNFNKKITFNANDELKTLADSFNNMTEKLSQIRNSLIEAKEEAERSNELKSEFLAQISHEIRTPINTMLNYSTLIEEASLKNQKKGTDYFNIMCNASQRIIRTIDLILNISEIQKGSYQPKMVKLNVCKDVIDILEKEYRLFAAEKKLEFIIERKYKNCYILADQYTVTQIFQNLIDNAIKYTDKGFIKIVLENEQDYLVIKVIDSGIGISEQQQKEIFEFYKEQEQRYVKNFHGTGLGILLVQNYCEINNAKIKVTSKEGIGSEFEVKFNLVVN